LSDRLFESITGAKTIIREGQEAQRQAMAVHEQLVLHYWQNHDQLSDEERMKLRDVCTEFTADAGLSIDQAWQYVYADRAQPIIERFKEEE
jgi:hypothetical protein